MNTFLPIKPVGISPEEILEIIAEVKRFYWVIVREESCRDYDHFYKCDLASGLESRLNYFWNIDKDWDNFWEDEDIKEKLLMISDNELVKLQTETEKLLFSKEEILEIMAASRLLYREFFLEREYATKESQKDAERRFIQSLNGDTHLPCRID